MSFNQGLAVGTAAGMAGQRLNSKSINQNDDQILIKSKHGVKECVEKISETRPQWIGEGNEIVQAKSETVSFIGVFFLATITLTSTGFIWLILYETPLYLPRATPLPFIQIILIVLFTGLLSGRMATSGYAKLKYIDIKESGKETLILIEVYDFDGTRNIDDDEIYNIINSVEGIRLS